MKVALNLAALVAALASAHAVAGAPEDNVIGAFTKMQARTQSGMTYRDYWSAVGDANAALLQYKNSRKPKSGFVAPLDAAMSFYQGAGQVWQHGLTLDGGGYIQGLNDKFERDCPGIQAKQFSGGYYYGDVVACYWQRAGERIDSARQVAGGAK